MTVILAYLEAILAGLGLLSLLSALALALLGTRQPTNDEGRPTRPVPTDDFASFRCPRSGCDGVVTVPIRDNAFSLVEVRCASCGWTWALRPVGVGQARKEPLGVIEAEAIIRERMR